MGVGERERHLIKSFYCCLRVDSAEPFLFSRENLSGLFDVYIMTTNSSPNEVGVYIMTVNSYLRGNVVQGMWAVQCILLSRCSPPPDDRSRKCLGLCCRLGVRQKLYLSMSVFNNAPHLHGQLGARGGEKV